MTLEEYKAVKAEKYPYEELDRAEWKVATTEAERTAICARQRKWREEHNARVEEAKIAIEPTVGMKCTVCFWSDYRAATVTRIISPKEVAVCYNEVICKDWYAGEYEIREELKDNHEVIFTKRKNGRWCEQDQQTKDSVKLMLHYQYHYIDPHF